MAGNYKDAAANFNKAALIAPANGEPQMNLGLIEMLNKNYSKANQLFGAAAGVNELNDALGVYYLKQGDNAAAARAFADTKSNNAALAQILTKDYNKAKGTLAAINTPDATTFYLMAILGARTGNQQMLNTNLKQAVRLDSSLRERASKDLELADFTLPF